MNVGVHAVPDAGKVGATDQSREKISLLLMHADNADLCFFLVTSNTSMSWDLA